MASPDDAEARDASVHLHLRGPLDEEAVAGLRQQLAACLASGISRVEVHVESQSEIELPVLRTLHGAAQYLRDRGGALRLRGARAQVRRTLRTYQLNLLVDPLTSARDTQPVAAPDEPGTAVRQAPPGSAGRRGPAQP